MAVKKSNEQCILEAIGLTPAAATCYLVLRAQAPLALRVKHIQSETAIAKSSLYRALAELTTTGFASSSRVVTAAAYRAVAIDQALVNYAQYQRHLAQPLLRDQVLQNSPLSRIVSH